MIDKETKYYILLNLLICFIIYCVLIFIKNKAITFNIIYIIAGLVNFITFFIAYYFIRKAIKNNESKNFFLYFIQVF